MAAVRSAIFTLVALTLTQHAPAQSAFYLKDGDRVVFYGDSITDQRLYTTFVESFLLTRFPQMKVDFIHSGWGGDRVTGGGGGPVELRLSRDVAAYRPTVVTIMLGMNDGRYRAYDQEIFESSRSVCILERETASCAKQVKLVPFLLPDPGRMLLCLRSTCLPNCWR